MLIIRLLQLFKARLTNSCLAVKVPLRGTFVLLCVDQAAMTSGPLAWSFEQIASSKHFSVSDAIAEQIRSGDALIKIVKSWRFLLNSWFWGQCVIVGLWKCRTFARRLYPSYVNRAAHASIWPCSSVFARFVYLIINQEFKSGYFKLQNHLG